MTPENQAVARDLEALRIQNREFEAASVFAEQVRRHGLTPVVDDDYPEVRHAYEAALRDLLDALEANGRIAGRRDHAPFTSSTGETVGEVRLRRCPCGCPKFLVTSLFFAVEATLQMDTAAELVRRWNAFNPVVIP